MSKDDPKEINKKEVKRTRKAAEAKPIYVVYKANAEGNDIDLLAVTRKSDEVLSLTSEDPSVRFKRVVTKL